MTTGSEEVTSPSVVRGDDAYHLTPEGIKEPPEGWGPSLRYFGPGLILSASIVGSGELIATTTLGAQAGFAILWMVIFGFVVFGDVPDGWTLVGASIICLSGFYIMNRERQIARRERKLAAAG